MDENLIVKNKLYKRISFGLLYLLSWFVITSIYSSLYFKFLDKSHISTLGGHIAGFFGLFTPIGPLSIIIGLFAPSFIFANIASIILILISIIWGIKRGLGFKKGILFIFGSLLVITFISDLIKGLGFISWYIFTHGMIPPLS